MQCTGEGYPPRRDQHAETGAPALLHFACIVSLRGLGRKYFSFYFSPFGPVRLPTLAGPFCFLTKKGHCSTALASRAFGAREEVF
jgi:hypothetical protein